MTYFNPEQCEHRPMTNQKSSLEFFLALPLSQRVLGLQSKQSKHQRKNLSTTSDCSTSTAPTLGVGAVETVWISRSQVVLQVHCRPLITAGVYFSFFPLFPCHSNVSLPPVQKSPALQPAASLQPCRWNSQEMGQKDARCGEISFMCVHDRTEMSDTHSVKTHCSRMSANNYALMKSSHL